MNDEEAERWRQGFKTLGVYPWVTAGPDIEAYFCQSDYLAALYDISLDEAEGWRQDAAKKVSKAREKFLAKRQNVVRVVWPNGGSPDAEAMRATAGGISPAAVKVKKLHAALKPLIKAAGRNDILLNAFTIPDGFVIAPELNSFVAKAVEG